MFRRLLSFRYTGKIAAAYSSTITGNITPLSIGTDTYVREMLADKKRSHVHQQKPHTYPGLKYIKEQDILTRRNHSTSSQNQTNHGEEKHRQHYASGGRNPKYQDYIFIAGILGTIGYFTRALFKTYVKEIVEDQTIDAPHDERDETLSIIDSSRFKSAGDIQLTGRSGTSKIYLVDDEGNKTYFYHKASFERSMLINELIVGELGRALMGQIFPRVYAVQHIDKEDPTKSTFTFCSESLSGISSHDNLETWCEELSHDLEEEKFGPKLLGLSIAFDKLFGKTDTKLANLVVKRDQIGDCYSIDHESAFRKAPEFILDAHDGLISIGEFSEKKFDDVLLEQALDNTDPSFDSRANPNQPLRDEPKVLALAEPAIKNAIDADIKNGRILAFYQRFATMNDQQLEDIFQPFGKLIHEDEKAAYLAKLHHLRKQTRVFLSEHGHELNNKIVTNPIPLPPPAPQTPISEQRQTPRP